MPLLAYPLSRNQYAPVFGCNIIAEPGPEVKERDVVI